MISDTADLKVDSEHRLVIEHVVPLDEWKRFRPAGDWGAYVAERITSVIEEYGGGTVISLSPVDGAAATAIAALSPVVLPAMGRSHTNLV